jgi:hypothetical protein
MKTLDFRMCMKKVLCLFVILLLTVSGPCFAKEINSDDLLSLVKLTAISATPDKVTSILGKPMKVEENKKRTSWYYNHGNTNLVISWSKKSTLFEKFSFTCESAKKSVFDTRLSKKLKSGATDIITALALLGTPKDMTIKGAKQEMHYAYEHNVLRLFFRDRMLVDYCLY